MKHHSRSSGATYSVQNRLPSGAYWLCRARTPLAGTGPVQIIQEAFSYDAFDMVMEPPEGSALREDDERCKAEMLKCIFAMIEERQRTPLEQTVIDVYRQDEPRIRCQLRDNGVAYRHIYEPMTTGEFMEIAASGAEIPVKFKTATIGFHEIHARQGDHWGTEIWAHAGRRRFLLKEWRAR